MLWKWVDTNRIFCRREKLCGGIEPRIAPIGGWLKKSNGKMGKKGKKNTNIKNKIKKTLFFQSKRKEECYLYLLKWDT